MKSWASTVTTNWSSIRVGSAVAMSGNVRVRLSLSCRVTKRDCVRCMRDGKIGNGRSSPSDRSPAVAVTFSASARRRRGAVTANVNVAAPPLVV